MVEVGEVSWKNETKREVLLPTQRSHLIEKLFQAKAYCSGKCIVFRLHSCRVSEPCETIALLHHRDLLHLFRLGASCKASFLLSGKEGWTKHIAIQQMRNALWRQSKSSPKIQGRDKIGRACQGKLPRCWPKCIGHREVYPRSFPSSPWLLPRQRLILNLPVWQRQSWDGDFPPPSPKAGSDEVQRPFDDLTNCFQCHPSARSFSLWAGRTANLPLHKVALCCPFGIRRHSFLLTGLTGSVLLKKIGPSNKQNKETVRPKWLAKIFRWVGCPMCFVHP